MPRGVYDRSKSKAEKTSAPVTKKSPIIKAATAKVVAKTIKAAPKASKVKAASVGVPAASESKGDMGYGSQDPNFSPFGLFNVLGANIATLSHSFQQVASSAVLSKLISDELAENIKALTALRSDIFVQKAEPIVATSEITEEPAQEEETEAAESTQVAAPVLPLPTAPTLPQGNASYTPPAPPALPHPHH